MNYEKPLEKYFVGELVFTRSWQDNDHKEKNKITLNGAIYLPSRRELPNFIDYDKCKYDRVFTIFFESHGEYYCLHNKKWYSINQYQNYCQNLVPLKSLLPVIGYKWPTTLSPKKALHLFNIFFKQGLFLKQDQLYDRQKRLRKDRLYVGDLYLWEGYRKLKINQISYQHQNLARRLLLEKNASLISLNTFDTIDEEGLEQERHDYGLYETLFLEYDGKGMYNLHNFDFYDNEDMIMTEGRSACDNLMSLEEVLKNNGMVCKKEELSIHQALRLYRKLENKK